MKLKHLGLIVIGTSMVSFVAPSALLPFLIKYNAGTEAKPALDGGLEARRVKYSTNVAGRSGRGNEYTSNYINETKAAVTKKIKEKGSNNDFEVSKIFFTSEKFKRVAGQRQVALSFTYELKYRNGKPVKKKGEILLASDEAGNWFYSTINI